MPESCEMCTLVFSNPDPPHLTRLLLPDNTDAVLCVACSRRRIEARAFAQKPAHALHVMNELVTPEVEYENWKEFAELVYAVQDNYCACLVTAVYKALQRVDVSVVLGHVRGFPLELDHLRESGPEIIMQLTKKEGLFWCQMVAHLIYTRVKRAAAIFNDVMEALGERDEERARRPQDINMLIDVMQQEVRYTFSGAMPFSIYTLCSGFVSTLLVKNFTLYDNYELTAFTTTQFQILLLTLCMGLHKRLGACSPLLELHEDVLQSICAHLTATQLTKHIIFHTHEQWLVA